MLCVLRDLARFAALFLDFGLLSTSRSAECESGIPLFLREIWPTAEHDPRRPPAAICSPSSKTGSQRRTYRARTSSAGWSLPTAHAQRPAWKAKFFAPDHRRYDASLTSGCTRSDRTKRMDTPAETELIPVPSFWRNVFQLETGALPSCGDRKARRKFRAVE